MKKLNIRINFGELKGSKIITDTYPNTRPTMNKVKEGIFNITDFKDKTVFDIFSGTGQLGFEAISLGAKEVIMVDKDRLVVKNMRQTAKNLNLTNVKIYNTDYRVALKQVKQSFDIIFVDPPYKNTDFYKTSFKTIHKYNLLNKDGIIISEIDKKSMSPSDYEGMFSLKKELRYGNTIIMVLELL